MHWCPLLQVSVRQTEALTLALFYACHAAVCWNQQCDMGPEIVVRQLGGALAFCTAPVKERMVGAGNRWVEFCCFVQDPSMRVCQTLP